MIPQYLKHFRVRSPYSLPSPELSTSQQLANLEYWQFRPGLGDRRKPIFDHRAIVSHAPKPNFQQTSTTPSFVELVSLDMPFCSRSMLGRRKQSRS